MFIKKQIDMDMIIPTSKISLKTSCIRACNGDIDKAMKLYDYFAKDLTNLPDFDAVQPTVFEQAKDMIGGTLSWIDNNQDKIVGYYNIIQQMRGNNGISTQQQDVMNVPPIPND